MGRRKTNLNKENKLPSMYLFRQLIEVQSAGENRIQKQNKLLAKRGIDTDFSNNLTKDIREKCKKIGENGWAHSPYWSPNKNETWDKTWDKMIQENKSEKILVYFTSNDYSLLHEIIFRGSYQFGNFNWWKEATDLFFKKYYLGCAMILTALLERGIRDCPIDSWKQKVTKFYESAIVDRISQIYNEESIEPISRYIDTVLLLPSLDGFITSFFDGGYRFDNGIEPQYLERNWLMHGMTDRNITEEDCIKLFNANATLCYLKTTVFQVDYTL